MKTILQTRAKIILLDGTLQEAGSIVWRDGSCLGYGRGDNPLAPMYNFRRDVDYCSGAFLLTPRKVWQQLQGFDEAFKPRESNKPPETRSRDPRKSKESPDKRTEASESSKSVPAPESLKPKSLF